MADEPDTQPEPPPTAPWRHEATDGLPAVSKVSPRRRVAVGTLAFLAVGLVTYGGLLWLKPLPRPTLFVWAPSEYPNFPFGSIPFAKQDQAALAEAGWFTVKPLQLAQLADVGTQETVVLSLSGRATCDEQGNVYLFADDAEPGAALKTALPLRKVLTELRDCNARRRFVIVDVFWPSDDPYVPDLVRDLPRRVIEELERTPDPNRLALLSCRSGQIPHQSPDLQRSIFGYYLEEGLRGWADFDDSPLDDRGRVTARRLAHFVQARVERWVMFNRTDRQTPILIGDGPDFSLVSLPTGQPMERRSLPAARTYPAWLTAGWQVREQWQRDDRPRVAAWLARQLDTVLLEAERAWACGGDEAKIQAVLRMELDRIDKTYAPLAALPTPEPVSLAAVVADPVLVKGVQDAVKKVDETIRKNPKAEDANRETAKVVEEFVATLQKKPAVEVDAAVFAAAAADPFPRRGAVLLYQRFLMGDGDVEGSPSDGAQPRPTGGRFEETQVLRRLAGMAEGMRDGEWPVRAVRKLLELTRRAATANSRAAASVWLRESAEAAAMKRHDAEVLFFARGFAPLTLAEKTIDDALAAYAVLVAKQDVLDRGQRTLDDALANLPWLARVVNNGSGDVGVVRVRNTVALADLLLADAARPQSRLEEIAYQTGTLQNLIEMAYRSFESAAVAELVKRAKGPDGVGLDYRELETLLLVPWGGAERRAEIWAVSRELGAKLAQRVADLDVRDKLERPNVEIQTGDAAQPELFHLRRRVDGALDLLRLAGTKESQLDELTRLKNVDLPAESNAAPSAEIYRLEDAIHQTWTTFLPKQWGEANGGWRDQNARVWPGWLRRSGMSNALVQATAGPWRRARTEQWGWLGSLYRFESRDPDAPAFDAKAAFALRDFTPPERPHVLFPAKATAIDVNPARPKLTAEIPVQVVGPAARLLTPRDDTAPRETAAGLLEPATASSILPDDDWLRVSLEPERLGTKPGTTPLAVTVTLRPGAELSTSPRPLGFLVRLQSGSKSTYHKVTLPYLPNPERVELILSTSPQQPAAPFADLRLRPSKGKQPFYVFVRNGAEKPRNLQAELRVNQELVPGGTVTVAVGARQTVRIPFPGMPLDKIVKKDKGDAPVDLPPLDGPLNLRVVDKETNEVLAEREVKVTQASPREYVRIPSIRFEPEGPKQPKNKLEVTVRAGANLTGPPCVVELVLAPRRIPGLKAVRDGVFRGELTSPGQEIKLYATDLVFEPGSDEEGVAYLTIDGIPRAIVFRVTFARFGEPTTPREDDRPALRIVTDRYFRTGSRWEGRVEVDNPPTGAKLDVSLGRYSNGAFDSELKHAPLTARQKGIGFGIRPTDGALEFEPYTRDWIASFDNVPVRGERLAHARLLSDNGEDVVPRVDEVVVFDDQVPDRVAFIDLPKQAQVGKPLVVQATGQDKLAGLKDVTFFVGATGDDKKIPSAASQAPGVQVPGKDDVWTGKLQMPSDKKGSVEVGVQFTNRVGLSAFAKGTVELVDFDPVKNAPGTIQGEVVEGDIVQAGLLVILLDEKGKKFAEKKTAADGTFAFEKLPPGKYTLVCEKPSAAARRRAVRAVTVEPAQSVRIRLELTL